MARPWDVTSDEIEQWSRCIDAPWVLPDLVRRMLLATMPLSRISMSAHAGTRLAGLDGVVHALDESPLCPGGPSVWELSVEGDRGKLNDDYRKRSNA